MQEESGITKVQTQPRWTPKSFVPDVTLTGHRDLRVNGPEGSLTKQCICQVFHCWCKLPGACNLKEISSLAPSFCGFRPGSAGSGAEMVEGMAGESCSLYGSQEKEWEGRGRGGGETLWRRTLSDAPLLTRPHLLAVLWAMDKPTHECRSLHNLITPKSTTTECLRLLGNILDVNHDKE